MKKYQIRYIRQVQKMCKEDGYVIVNRADASKSIIATNCWNALLICPLFNLEQVDGELYEVSLSNISLVDKIKWWIHIKRSS